MSGRPTWGSAAVTGLAGFVAGLLVAALLVAGRASPRPAEVTAPPTTIRYPRRAGHRDRARAVARDRHFDRDVAAEHHHEHRRSDGGTDHLDDGHADLDVARAAADQWPAGLTVQPRGR